MIVRCTNCVSAFAVDDEKVANRKFAFTCPKCGTENIFDNRKHEEKPLSDDLFFDEDRDQEIKEPSAKDSAFEHDLGSEDSFFEEPAPAPEKKAAKGLNLELEETPSSDEEIAFDDDFLVDEKPPKKAAPAEEEISFDEDMFLEEEKPAKKAAPAEEEISFDEDMFLEEEKPAKKAAPAEEEISFDEDMFLEEEKPAKKAAPAEEGISFDEDIFLEEEKPAKKAAPVEEEISFDEDMFLEEEKPAKKAAPAEEEISFDEDIFLEEEKPAKKAAPAEEEISFDEDIFLEEEKPAKKAAPAEEEISFDEDIFLEEEKPAKKAAPAEEEISFDEDIFLEEEKPAKKAAPAEEEISFDEDIFLEEEKPAKKAAPAEEEISFDDEFIIDESETPADAKKDRKLDEELLDIGLELEVEAPEKGGNDRDVKISSQDDIDAMFADLPSEDEIPEPKKVKAPAPDDDITVNLDELDIELEGGIQPSGDEFISFDDTGEPAQKKKAKSDEPLFDDDITIDMDSLDIDIEEAGDINKPSKPGEGLLETVDEEELILNIDEFEDEFAAEAVDMKKPAAVKSAKKETPPEDDITLDLDSLDIELDENEVQIPVERPVKGKQKADAEAIDESAEEDLKLHLDEMDVDIEELEEKPAKKVIIEESEEDESITIDLETLDIEVAETPEVMKGEMTEEDEKLTLDDAGLTFSELAEEEKLPEHPQTDEDELFLSLDEIDPDLKLQVIGEEAPKGEKLLSETVEELPEIDLEEYEAVIREEKFKTEKDSDIIIEGIEDFETLELSEISEAPRRPLDMDILEYEEEGEDIYTPAKGSTTFSIDYSLKYSRLGALLRLMGLYMFSMIPHFIVMLIYTILSGILGFINQIVILSTGRCVEDFSQITENTLRYFLYIKTNITGIVEDRPVYAGRESLNHQMQLNITYPVKYSRNLAILRLSIIGIWFITIPHFILMSLLTILVPFVYLAGIITVIATRRWPNPLFIFLTRYFRYLTRISSFLLGLTDEYPPFRFD